MHVTQLRLYLVVDIQQHQVVSSGHHKVHSGVVGVHHLVFGTVEDRVVYRQHGCDRQHFLRTFVPGEKHQRTNVTEMKICMNLEFTQLACILYTHILDRLHFFLHNRPTFTGRTLA